MSVDLKVDFCSYEAAKWAVEKWHYSKTMPKSKLVHVGVWEDGRFIGAVIFGYGAMPEIGSPYGLRQIEISELVRVALTKHVSHTSRVVSLAIKLLRHQSSGLRLIVSYADPAHNHTGTIYQAMNWVYVGENTGSSYEVLCPDGEWRHARAGIHKYGSCAGFPTKRLPKKHKYLYPLDRAMRRQIAPLAKPYPKRDTMRPTDGSTLALQLGGGDSTSTRPLILTGQTPRRASG